VLIRGVKMVLTDLESRRKKILEIVINTYIETVLPVGSSTVASKSRLGLSPATIRNIMSDLEEEGYLFQPHTSAGRVPTDKGYRYYVENIMGQPSLTQQEAELLDASWSNQPEDFNELAMFLSRLLSETTGQVGLLLLPRMKKGILKRIKIFSVSPNKIIVVLMTESDIVKERIVKTVEAMDEVWLEKICKYINSECPGKPLGLLREFLENKLLFEKDSLHLLCGDALKIFKMSGLIEEKQRICLEGTSYLLRQPEFRDAQRSRSLLEFLEKKNELLELAQEDLDCEGIRIKIGKEIPFEEMQSCSFVTSMYKVKNNICGMLGIIGPTRMEYPKAISIVDYITRKIGQFYER